MKTIKTDCHKGRMRAELEDGRYVLSNGLMELMICEKTDKDMKAIESGIVGGVAMKTMEDFKWCVENL